MAVSEDVRAITDKVLTGVRPTRDELLRLVRVRPYSHDYFHLMYAERTVNANALDGFGELHARVLVGNADEHAADPLTGGDPLRSPADADGFLEAMSEGGVNAIRAVASQDVGFEDYLAVVGAIVQDGDIPVIADVRVSGTDELTALGEAGVVAVHVCVDLDEDVAGGVLSPSCMSLMQAVVESDLKLSVDLCGLSPSTGGELAVDAMIAIASFSPHAVGAYRSDGEGGFNNPESYRYRAALRLLTGVRTPFGNGTSILWTAVGMDIPDVEKHVEINYTTKNRFNTLTGVIEDLENDGYEFAPGPSGRWQR